MKNQVYFLNALSICIFLTLTASSSAAEPLRVEGTKCSAEDDKQQTWVGFFKGHRDMFSPLKGGNVSKAFSLSRCFKAEVECNSWAYWMQADFPTGDIETSCRKSG